VKVPDAPSAFQPTVNAWLAFADDGEEVIVIVGSVTWPPL
jgi:hypothetical protein